MFVQEITKDMGVVMEGSDINGIITLAYVDKQGTHIIPLTLDEWTIFQTHLTSVKRYLIAAGMKIQEWKDSSIKAKEQFKPLLCEQVKINDMFGLFLSMYQGKDETKNFWFVRLSLRAYFTKDNQMIPLEKPAITFKPGKIDKLIETNGSLYLYLKTVKESHIHPESDSCMICRFINSGIIVHHTISSNNDENMILEQLKACVRDFQHLNHPGQCLITIYQEQAGNPAEMGNSAPKKKMRIGELVNGVEENALKKALSDLLKEKKEEEVEEGETGVGEKMELMDWENSH